MNDLCVKGKEETNVLKKNESEEEKNRSETWKKHKYREKRKKNRFRKTVSI